MKVPTCKNCRYFNDVPLLVPVSVTSTLEFPLCSHPSRTSYDQVRGTQRIALNCSKARMDANDCGPTGRLFVPSLRSRIVASLFGRAVQ